MKVTVGKDGSLVVPPEMVSAMGLSTGNQATVEGADGKILISPITSLPLPGISGRGAGTVAEAIKKKNLQTGVRFVKGIGPKLAALLEKREIRTVEDALYLLPLRYEDRRELIPVASLRPGQTAVFYGRVLSADEVATKGGRRVFEVLVGDDSGSVTCKWFHANAVWMKRTWKVGRNGVFSGEISQFGYQREVHHPDVEWLPEGADPNSVLTSDPANFGRIVPVYPLTEGLHQKTMRRIMKEVLDVFLDNLESVVPAALLPSDFPA